MFFIGDVHAQFPLYLGILEQLGKGATTLQVGDFGMGFRIPPEMEPQHKFIRGNHDDPGECNTHPNYLGDFGVWGDLFFAGGGYSIDVIHRTPGISWWPNEQLNFKQMSDATALYCDMKPEIVVTHQCPESIEDTIFDFPHRYTNATSKFLDALLEYHRPKLWVFGHYHLSRNQRVKKTRFVCVRPLEVFQA